MPSPPTDTKAPRRAPSKDAEAPDEYEAHNKDTDQQAPPEEARVAYRFNVPEVVHFGATAYPQIEAASGRLRAPTHVTARVPAGRIEHGPVLDVEVDALPGAQGYLLVPFGYRPTAVEGALELEVRPGGVYFRRTGSGRARIALETLPAQDLTETERRTLTRVDNPPALERLPENWQAFVRDLRARRPTMSNLDVAHALRDFMHATLKYEVDASSERGFVALCARGAVQCDGAGLIFATILRAYLDVPVIPVGGAKSARAVAVPEASVVLDQSTPHMFGAVYDEKLRRFVVVDPTPSEATREKNNQEKRDPRFENWPEPGGVVTKRAELDLQRMWRAFFESVEAPGWSERLTAIVKHVQASAAQGGLAPEHDILLRNLEYVSELAKHLPRGSFAGLARSLGVPHDRDEELKQDYLALQVIARLAPYGAEAAEEQTTYRHLASLAADWLKSMPAAARLTAVSDLEERLPGPLSREALRARPGLIHMFRQMAELNEKIRLARIRERERVPNSRFESTFAPQDNEFMDFRQAEDFENMHLFERQGFHPRYDAVRVFNGEMYIREYQEEVSGEAVVPKENDGREVTFILADLSGSMEMSGDGRGAVRDRLIQTWIDELAGQRGTVYLLPYRGVPEQEMKIDTPETAKAQFELMLRDGEFFPSQGGNDTAAAFTRATEIASRLGSVRKVNFRLITDGDEVIALDVLMNAKAKLGRKVVLNLTAVTLVKGNEALAKFVRESSDRNLVRESVYFHLTAQDVARLQTRPDERRSEASNRFLPENYRRLHEVGANVRARFKNAADRVGR